MTGTAPRPYYVLSEDEIRDRIERHFRIMGWPITPDELETLVAAVPKAVENSVSLGTSPERAWKKVIPELMGLEIDYYEV